MKQFLGCLGASALVLAMACSSSSGGDDDGDDDVSSSSGDSPASGGSAPVSTASCTERCSDRADQCGVPDSFCDDLCGADLSERALACIEDLDCSAGEDEASACVRDNPTGSSGGGGSSSSGNVSSGGSSSGGGSCVALLHGGCNTLNNPQTCCTTDDNPTVTCFGNADGQGHAQCCVPKDGKCTDVSECCGYEGAADSVKDFYKCQSGTCTML